MSVCAAAAIEASHPHQVRRTSPSFGAVLIGSALGLLVGSLVASVLSGLALVVLGQGHADGTQQGLRTGFGLFLLAVPVGLLPTLAYGAPLYWCLAAWRRINPFTVACVGMAPGLCLALLDAELWPLAVLFAGYGVCVALATHLLVRRIVS